MRISALFTAGMIVASATWPSLLQAQVPGIGNSRCYANCDTPQRPQRGGHISVPTGPSVGLVHSFQNRLNALLPQIGSLALDIPQRMSSFGVLARSTDTLLSTAIVATTLSERNISALHSAVRDWQPRLPQMREYIADLKQERSDLRELLSRIENIGFASPNREDRQIAKVLQHVERQVRQVEERLREAQARVFRLAAKVGTRGLPAPSSLRGLPKAELALYEDPAITGNTRPHFFFKPQLTYLPPIVVAVPNKPVVTPTAASASAITASLSKVDQQTNRLRELNRRKAQFAASFDQVRKEHGAMASEVSALEDRISSLNATYHKEVARVRKLPAQSSLSGISARQHLFQQDQKLVEKVFETAIWGNIESTAESALALKVGVVADISSLNKFRKVMEQSVKLAEGLSAVIRDTPEALAYDQDQIKDISLRVDRLINEFGIGFGETVSGAPGWMRPIMEEHWRR